MVRLSRLFLVPLLLLPLSGCGTYVVAKTVTGAGKLAVGTTVGAVKLTGKAVAAVLPGGDDEEDESE